MTRMYVGFAITVEEACRLLKLEESVVNSYYDTAPIQAYLKTLKSILTFQYIDKGACLFGLSIDTCGLSVEHYHSVDDTILRIITTKKMFLDEVKRLNIDISKVYLTWIEEESHLVENPEPCVLHV